MKTYTVTIRTATIVADQRVIADDEASAIIDVLSRIPLGQSVREVAVAEYVKPQRWTTSPTITGTGLLDNHVRVGVLYDAAFAAELAALLNNREQS